MKKLMIAAVAVAFAAIAQAATVTWSATPASTTLPDSSVANGVVAYLFEGALSNTVLESIAAGEWTPADYLATVNAAANGTIMKAGVGNYSNQTVDFSMLLFDAATVGEATNFKYAEVKNVAFVTANKPVQFATPLTAAQWTEIAPEPTSGMMLLLGMSVLALRRRRA